MEKIDDLLHRNRTKTKTRRASLRGLRLTVISRIDDSRITRVPGYIVTKTKWKTVSPQMNVSLKGFRLHTLGVQMNG